MTAPPIPEAPPWGRLWLAALALGCCLTIYVVLIPFLPRGSAGGWPLVLAAVADAIAVTVLLLLARLQKVGSAHRDVDMRMRDAISHLSLRAQQQAEQLRQQTDRLSTQGTHLTAQSTQLNTQSAQIAEFREAQTQLQAECARLRAARADLRDQLEATQSAVEHMTRERVPAALAGQDIPRSETEGVDAQVVKLLDEAVASAAQAGDRQESMRSAVVSLSRRVQAAAHRLQEEATLMADRHPGDADVLDVSMRVDHAAAQQARNAQSIAVLCGEWPGQQWPEPLPLVDVVRAAAGRITAFRRIDVAGDPDIAVVAPVVEPMIHLVAELLANATQSSPPATQVPVSVRVVQRGAVIEVHDCGVGLDDYRLTRARDIATGITPITLAELGEVPQTGLAVVGHYVRRYGLRLDISESVYGGVRAVVGIPTDLVETVAPAEAMRAPVTPEARPAEPVPASPEPVPALRTEPASAPASLASTPADLASTPAPMQGLPRRRSPRRGAAAVTRDSQPEEITGTSWSGQQAHPVDPAAQPSPEEAGAWMGALLSNSGTDDNSAERGEQT